jgi:hypothetical protein
VAALVESDLRDGLNRERLLYALVMLAEWQRLAVRGRAKLNAHGPRPVGAVATV